MGICGLDFVESRANGAIITPFFERARFLLILSARTANIYNDDIVIFYAAAKQCDEGQLESLCQPLLSCKYLYPLTLGSNFFTKN